MIRSLLFALALVATPALADPPNLQEFINQRWQDDQTAHEAALAAKDAQIVAAQAAAAAATQQLNDFRAYVEGKLGPLWDVAWEKQSYRGYALDYSGYVETFRSDFNDLSQITPSSGNGPWFSGGAGVHTYFGNAYFDDCIVQNPQLCSVTDGVLTLRMMTPDGNVATSWRSTILQTMKTDGTGFAQSKGLFEVRAKMPAPPAVGFWAAPLWLLSANEFASRDDGKYGIEYDLAENYGAQPTSTNPGAVDKGIHTTFHVKRRRVPLPGDYPDRVMQGLYSDPQTVFDTDPMTGLATTTHTYPPNVAVFDGQFHTYTVTIDDNWIVQYFDGKSIGRIANKEGFASTPLYLLINQTLKRPSTNNGLTSPVDYYIDYVVVMQKQ